MSLPTFSKCLLTAAFAFALVSVNNCQAQEADQKAEVSKDSVIRVLLNENGVLEGRVFAMVGAEQAPMVAKVSLAADGKTVASGETDVVGNFSFSDVEPGTYTMVGVSGEYVGDQVVVVAANSDEESEAEEGVYTALALQVAPVEVYGDASYVGVPMDSYAVESSCSTCDAGVSSFSACGGSCGGCGGGGIAGGGGGGLLGGSSLRRLALLGAAVAIPVAIATGNDASPDE